jgi:hypothetical protein
MLFPLNKTNYPVWRPLGSLYEHKTCPKKTCNRYHYETKTEKFSSGQ